MYQSSKPTLTSAIKDLSELQRHLDPIAGKVAARNLTAQRYLFLDLLGSLLVSSYSLQQKQAALLDVDLESKVGKLIPTENAAFILRMYKKLELFINEETQENIRVSFRTTLFELYQDCRKLIHLDISCCNMDKAEDFLLRKLKSRVEQPAAREIEKFILCRKLDLLLVNNPISSDEDEYYTSIIYYRALYFADDVYLGVAENKDDKTVTQLKCECFKILHNSLDCYKWMSLEEQLKLSDESVRAINAVIKEYDTDDFLTTIKIFNEIFTPAEQQVCAGVDAYPFYAEFVKFQRVCAQHGTPLQTKQLQAISQYFTVQGIPEPNPDTTLALATRLQPIYEAMTRLSQQVPTLLLAKQAALLDYTKLLASEPMLGGDSSVSQSVPSNAGQQPKKRPKKLLAVSVPAKPSAPPTQQEQIEEEDKLKNVTLVAASTWALKHKDSCLKLGKSIYRQMLETGDASDISAGRVHMTANTVAAEVARMIRKQVRDGMFAAERKHEKAALPLAAASEPVAINAAKIPKAPSPEADTPPATIKHNATSLGHSRHLLLASKQAILPAPTAKPQVVAGGKRKTPG